MLKSTKNKPKTKTQIQTFNWLEKHNYCATHAVSLTYNQPHIYRYLRAFSDGTTAKSENMLKKYFSGMSIFGNMLDRELFGYSSRRYGQQLYFVPILEGLGANDFPHWHCAIGVVGERANRIDGIVRKNWRKIPFGGREVDITPIYNSEGWSNYITKARVSPDSYSVCWDAVRTPIAVTLN